ncbi:non-ribosomal peptide synthetase [Streptomyces sp. ISL-11]|uniref:non-ribosomal peptide synthetase n=1 Tax=Streptomyces sp. ISL-11 TaxID=2819174 RepID=UPI001BE6EE7D|nr:non-ribosomal peptide synthetase [Streptomyces sp. ISL-11]MBT2382946.1 amino acid adenylation domain-containing protein [Streptomyces sp. ISL-11]
MTTTSGPGSTRAVPARPVHDPGVQQIPLSVGQEAMWVSWKLDPGQWTHIIPTPFRVRGTLDVDRLRQAVAAVGEAHPHLRARIGGTPDGPVLCWADAPPVPVVEHTVTGGLEEEVRRAWQRPFDLRRGPLARIDVLHGPDWTVLLPSVHHLVFDGASVLLLLDRLRRAYAGEPLDVAGPGPVLAAFAARSRELTDTPAGDAHRAYWRGALGGDLPVLDLPSSVEEPRYTVLDTALAPELATRLRARARELGVSYVTVLFGAYFALLRRYCGQEDLLASIPFHGRVDPAARETVGYFVNALPVRHQVRGEDSYATVVRTLRAGLRDAMAHGELPLPAILREAGLTGWESRARTHRTVFQYWHAGLREDVDVRDLRLRADGRECALTLLGMESSADYTLAVMVREDSGGTHVLWKDPTGAVGATLLRMLADDYTAVLEAVADDPDAAVGDLTDRVATAHGPVEPRRVAALIATHPAVRRAVVTPTGGGADLHARLLVDEPVAVADVLARVRDGFAGRAPVLRVETVQQPAAARRPGPDEAVTPSLTAMIGLWEEVLGIDGIVPDDSFFELGGHSLLAESLVVAVSGSLGRDVPLRTLFEYPRLRDFAAHLGVREAPSDTTADACPDLAADGVPAVPERAPQPAKDRSFPAAGFQQRIWLAERIDPGTGAYNVPLAWRVPGAPLEVETLARALELLVARHEILRTRFVEHGGLLRQHVDEPWRPRPAHVDLCGRDDRDTALRDWLDRAAGHRFVPAEGRLLTATLLETGESEQVLFLCLHHLVWDGESAGVFLSELSACYDEAADDRATAEPASPRGPGDGTDPLPAGPAGHDLRPASPHQERIGFIDQFEKGTVYPTAPVYHNLPLFLRLDRTPAAPHLQQAVDRVVAAHEALRTDLQVAEGRTVQRVHARAQVVPRWFDTAAEEPGEAPEALRAWAQEPFDLGRGPLLRVAAQPSPEGTVWLALLGHQAVVDRTALLVVAEDLLAALSGADVTGSSYLDWLDAGSEQDRRQDLDARAAALRGDFEPLRLPERCPRAAIHVYQERAVPVELPDDLPVAAFAERHGLSREDVHLAAFAALLGWYSGQEEMLVGVAHNGRRDGDRRVVGPLANLLPLRLRPAVGTSFEELATQVAAELANAREHDRAPFDELVRRLNPAKDMSRTALFDVLFTWADGPTSVTAPDGTAAGTLETGGGHGKYDLHLFVRPGRQGDTGRLVFNALYFDDAQMRLMAEHYARLMRALLTAPDEPIGAAEPLTVDERRTQLSVWNATDATYPETTLQGLLRARAEQRPEATALTDAATATVTHHTYRDLLERAGLLATGLVARGVLPGDRVALLLPRGAAQVEAMLAVLLAGAAYLPLDPALPEGRKEFILADSGARWVIVPDGPDGWPEPAAVPAAFTGEVVAPAGLAAAGAHDPSAGPGPSLPVVGPDSPAYCIYTSGTTGRPKGVVLTHRNAVRLISNDRFPFSFGPADVWTMFHSYAFDFSVWELFCGLAHGGRVVLVGEDDARDPRRFLGLLRRERVTVLNQTPSAFRQLLAAEQEDPDPLDHLRYVVFGGETLPPALLSPWLDSHPHVRPVNMYGITETTVHVTARTVTRADAGSGSSVIGTPIPTTSVHLMDPRTGRRLLPVGAVGEMYVGGAGVAAGYLNRPELDAERFVPNPFGRGPLFRTGDLARYRPDGVLEFLGRADSQVQLRGYRIEPGEIEARLREHPAVADAAVLLEDDRLVGYLLPRGEAPVPAELYAHLRAVLPEYMIPGALRTVDALPLTANGKLDPDALRAAAVALRAPEGRAPATPTAEAVAGLWAALLDLPRVGADDSFFALGGHSMLAVRLLGQVRDRFGVTVPLRALFERPRLQDFADLVDEQGGKAPVPRARRSGDTAAVAPPASGFQERVWLSERFAQDTAYNIVLAWRAPQGLDHDLLQQALTLLVGRHEILRTAFAEDGGRLRQHIGAPWTPPLDRVDLRDAADPDPGIRAWVEEQAAQPFDPASGRLLRPALADLGDRGRMLLLCLHHLVIDGESIPALLTELQQCYRAAEEGVDPPAPAAQYRDFTAAQEAERGSAGRAADLAYWDRHLAGAPPYAALPAPGDAEPHGAIALALPDDLPARLHPLQQEHGLSWFMVAATALAAVLHRTTGRRDVTFAVPVSTRDRAGFAGLIGPCLNTVVLRSRPADDATLLDLLRSVRAEVLDAFEHRGAPFEEVVERLNPAREPGRTPYADVTLNMNLLTGRTAPLGDGTLTPALMEPIGRRETKFALTVTLVDQDGRLSGALSYRGDRITSAEAGRVARRLTALLGALPSALRLPLDRLELDGPAAAAGEAGPLGLPGRRVQYRDFVAAQEAERGTARRAADLAHWAEHLEGAPEYTEFPAPAVPGPNGSVAVPLPADLLERMRPVQQAHGFSPYQLAAGALAALLHRWTGRDDVVFATPLAHRDHPGFAGLLGPCLNTVILRSRPAPDATLLDVLRSVRAEVLDAYEHGGAPFEEVVERLNPARRPGRTPYADVTLSLETEPGRPARLAGSPLARLPLAGDGAGHLGKLGLTVVLSLSGDTLGCRVAYRGDRYRRADVEQVAALFGRLLTVLPTALDTRVDALDLVGEEEEERLRGWEGGADAAPATSVPALVAHWVRHTPDAPAVTTAGGVLSYRDLHERARALAARIRPHLRAEDPVVALLFDRGEALVVAMLAAWYAGAAFCPVEPTAPAARVDALLADVDACAVLTADRQAAARLTATGATVLTLSGAGEPGAGPNGTRHAPDSPGEEAPAPGPEAVAYVVHTSGTTGEPKGVAVRHRSIAQLARWGQESFGLGPGDRIGWLLGVSFDATQWDVWSALASGSCVVPYEGPLAVTTLPRWLAERRVSVALLATPLAESVWAADPPLPHLRWMLVGAAALTRRPPRGTTYRVRNAYGPTESTVIALTHDLDAGDEGPLNTLGRPVAGTRVQVLDPYGRRCPAGVTGEIVLSGAGTAAGYWRRAELTRERFRPVGDGPGTAYRTGDRGRRLTDGTIEYLGRLDRQLKIRGYRIEPGEIEAELLRLPGVAAAVVHGDPLRSPSLVAYLVAGAGPRPVTAELLERLRSRLPSPMVPEAVVWLAALPLAPSGKVDTARLPRPGRADLPVAAARVAPSGGTEELIAGAWAEVLGLAEVGVHDNFFDLGGNSISLANLHALLVERLATELPLVALFEHPTVAAMARSLTGPPAPPTGSRNSALRERAARARQAASRRAAAPRPERARPAGQQTRANTAGGPAGEAGPVAPGRTPPPGVADDARA